MDIKNRRLTKDEFLHFWSRLITRVLDENCKAPYLGLREANVTFKAPYVRCTECEVISLAVMRILLKCAYHTGSCYGKVNIGYHMKIPKHESLIGSENILYKEEISFIIGPAIPLTDKDGNMVPNMNVYYHIFKAVMRKAEIYGVEVVSALFIRIYLKDDLGWGDKMLPLSSEELARMILELMNSGDSGSDEERKALPIKRSKKNYPKYITPLNPKRGVLRPFIVADLETVLVNEGHVPYAVGFKVIRPGENVALNPDLLVESYFSEDHIRFIHEFDDRSDRILFLFIERLKAVVKANKRIRTIYFHNLRRFDGILLIQYLISKGIKYRINPVFRNRLLYKLAVYDGKKLLFTFKDSLNLLPGSLDSLAKTLCPELGSKGSIDHENLKCSDLYKKREELKKYMIQDINLLGGVMVKAQAIYYSLYDVDIENILTVSSLALTIFRTKYYDANSWPIHIPSKNEDRFIRRGYYGGHADAYIPYGENLYYYDVNSLYPYIMKTFPMPGGVPVWRGHLEDEDLSTLFGFIEAYVECPSGMARPFLPYRDKSLNTLLFPTGEFVGVYYSEELKYARDLGYKILPIRGYLFEKKPSPFEGFITTLYGKRVEAKKSGDAAMVYVYKMLMNSLYGRFGIQPESTITVICDKAKYDSLLLKKNFIEGIKISEEYYLVSYITNKAHGLDTEWDPPRVSAVQLSAAITACSRIHMYPFISKEDCYYTDTDSVILGSPLEEEYISPTELGKFKLESKIKEGYFLAPKAYALKIEGDETIIKYKGAGKEGVDFDWFESQYKDPSQEKYITVHSNFRINWDKMGITKQESLHRLATPESAKRDRLYGAEKKTWLGTTPKIVKDYDSQDITVYKTKIKELEERDKKKKKKKKP